MKNDGPKTRALAVVFAILIAGLFRFENLGSGMQRNRITGEVCHISEECWFGSKFSSRSWLAASRAKATKQLQGPDEEDGEPAISIRAHSPDLLGWFTHAWLRRLEGASKRGGR
jgi:hypothetical protein